MNTLKKHWKYCIIASRITVVFWLAETIFFLILNGWHWKANSIEEEYCDNAVVFGMWICIFLFVSTISRVINIIVKE